MFLNSLETAEIFLNLHFVIRNTKTVFDEHFKYLWLFVFEL